MYLEGVGLNVKDIVENNALPTILPKHVHCLSLYLPPSSHIDTVDPLRTLEESRPRAVHVPIKTTR
jgi:hypothetical protein